MTILDNFNIYVQAIIVASIIVAFILLTNFIIYGFKLKVGEKVIRYIYSFSSGFLLVTAIVGQFVSAQTNLTVHWKTVNVSNGLSSDVPSFLQTTISVFVILIGFIIGIGLSAIMKMVFQKVHHSKEKHNHAETSRHSHLIENRYEHNVKKHDNHSKLESIMMIITHRIPAGIAMGALVYTSSILSHEGTRTYGLAMSSLMAFAIHLIPESLLLYFTRVHSGESRLKAAIITSGSLFIFYPLIIIGLFVGKIANSNDSMFWILPLMFVIIASILIWEVITELVPEFIHIKNNPKELWWMLVVFMIGIASSGIIQMIHFH